MNAGNSSNRRISSSLEEKCLNTFSDDTEDEKENNKKADTDDEKEDHKEDDKEEHKEGLTDIPPVDDLPGPGGTWSDVCFCLYKTDI